MNIVVCVKRVPDTEAKIRIGKDGKTVNPEGAEYTLNPYDEYAVEEALRIKERSGGGRVTVISLGPGDSASAIRSALAMGVDGAILLRAEGHWGDASSTASALAEALKGMEFDLLLFGKQAVDDDDAQVGPRVAQILGIPCVTVVTKLEIAGGRAIAERETETGKEVVEVSLPAAFTAEKGLNEPRYASLKGIMAAKRKPIEEREASVIPAKVEVLKLEYPPTRPPGRVVGEGAEAVPELVRLLREEARVI
ncbi:MAG: electron transfer flavoprotein subunit beta/FixA family protein [bacterium]